MLHIIVFSVLFSQFLSYIEFKDALPGQCVTDTTNDAPAVLRPALGPPPPPLPSLSLLAGTRICIHGAD